MGGWRSSTGAASSARFADAYPLLLIGSSALEEINARMLAAGRAALPMDRFRPNLVVDGTDPFEEDYTESLRAGDVVNIYHRAEPYRTSAWWWSPYSSTNQVALLRYAGLAGVSATVATDIRSSLTKICSPAELQRIEVIHLDGWVSTFLKGQGLPVRVFDQTARKACWDLAMAVADTSLGLKQRFYEEEWKEVVLANGCPRAF